MASTSSSGVWSGSRHGCCPARVARCCRGRTCPYRLRDACWFSHDDDPEEDPPCRDVAATSCRVVAATALDGLAGRIRRLERIVEQIGGVLAPQIWEPLGEAVLLGRLKKTGGTVSGAWHLLTSSWVPWCASITDFEGCGGDPACAYCCVQIMHGTPVPQIMPVQVQFLGLGCCCPLLYSDRCIWFDRAENCAGTAVAML